jgi:hypothetical protein
MIADYPEVSKAEMRYGTFPVHNKKFNQLIQYLEKLNKQLQVPNPTKKQIGLQDAINSQLNMERLKILTDDMKKKKNPSILDKALMALRFRNWCGMNTPIFENIKNDLDDPTNMFEIDKICLMHDIDYSKAKTKEDLIEADNKMLEAIRKKYIINFEENFVTGNYDMDFSNWSSSLKTFGNSALSLLQGAFNIGIAGSGVLPLVGSAIALDKIKYIYDEFKQRRTPRNYLPRLEDSMPYINRFGSNKMNILIMANLLAGATALRDHFLAVGAMSAIYLKKGIETFLGVDVVKLGEYEVSEKQLGEIIRVFELLQNEYLMDSDLKPIKIGNEWEKEEIEMPTIKQLNEGVGDIIKTNQTYFEKRQEVAEIVEEEEEQPVNEEPISDPYFIDNMDFLSKQRHELDAFMTELMSDFLYVTTDDAKENSIEENIEENIDENIEENIEKNKQEL